MTESVNVALIGSKFMGRAHSNAWLNVGKFFPVDPLPRMHTVVGRNGSELADFAQTWGWEHTSTDWRAAVESGEVGLVDIATPNDVHAEQAIAALEAGKHVACEKPLAGTLGRRQGHGRCGGSARGPDLRLVQLPPGAGGRLGAAAGRFGRAGPHLPRTRCLPAELGRPRHPAVVALPGRHRRFRGPRRPQRAHHRHGPVRHRRRDRHGRGSHRAHVHHRARHPDGLGRRGDRRRRSLDGRHQGAAARWTMRWSSSPASAAGRSPASRRAGWPPATTTPTGSRSTASAVPSASTSSG